MSLLKLYSHAIVCGTWAVVRAAGVHSDLLAACFLGLLAVAFVVSTREAIRRRRDGC